MARYRGILSINDEVRATRESNSSQVIYDAIMDLTEEACRVHGMKLALISDNEAQQLWVGIDPETQDEYVIEWRDEVALRNMG